MPRGRPPSGKARRTRIDFSLPPEVYSKAKAAANASDMSLRAWIVMVVEQSLKGVGMPVTSEDLDKVKEALALVYAFLDRLPIRGSLAPCAILEHCLMPGTRSLYASEYQRATP